MKFSIEKHIFNLWNLEIVSPLYIIYDNLNSLDCVTSIIPTWYYSFIFGKIVNIYMLYSFLSSELVRHKLKDCFIKRYLLYTHWALARYICCIFLFVNIFFATLLHVILYIDNYIHCLQLFYSTRCSRQQHTINTKYVYFFYSIHVKSGS